MTQDEAKEYINGNLDISTDGTLTSKSEDEAKTAETNSVDASVEIGDTIIKEPIEARQETNTNAKTPSKKKYTKEDRTKHAFKLEKDKRRALKEQLDNSNKRITELEEKLSKYKDLKEDDFKSKDAYIDYKVDMATDTKSLSALREQQQSQMYAYAQEVNETKLKNNFNDEERAQYEHLLDVAQHDFRKLHPEYGVDNFADILLKDEAVVEYLADSDNSPRMIRHFIAKPESLIRIMSITNPTQKVIALNDMEKAMMRYFNSQSKKKQKQLPSTGNIVTNTMNKTNTAIWDKKWSKQDAMDYIRNHR